MTDDEIEFISDAAQYLENPTLLMAIANIVGRPLEFFLKSLDAIAPNRVNRAVSSALMAALEVAIKTIGDKPDLSENRPTSDKPAGDGKSIDWWSKLSVTLSGAAGGLFGWPGLAVELPLTTTIMLRWIAATAQEFGENLDDSGTRLQCLTVFAYGGPSTADEAMESSYLTVRCGLQAVLQEASAFLGKVGAEGLSAALERGAAPALVRLIASIAARFNVVVTEKALGQSIPVLGAVCGAAINVAFIDHFNRVARYHFGLRRLEKKYGQERIQSLFREKALAIKQERKKA